MLYTPGIPGTPKRTVFILYLPGGGLFGIIPSVVMARLEELAETPVPHMFQVMDGVSTGSILVASMNVRHPGNPQEPLTTARGRLIKFCSSGPAFFPQIPNRMHKMITANTISVIEDMIDPLKADRLIIHELNKLCHEVDEAAINDEQKILAGELRQLATGRWLTKGRKNRALKICEKLQSKNESLSAIISPVSERIFFRSTTNLLGIVFRAAALSGMETIKNVWANNFLFDPELPKRAYQDMYGDSRMSDCLRSIYVSAYDPRRNRIITFFNRKDDFFSLDPSAKSTTNTNDHKLWDSVMASTASPFAFPPHVTEDGILCSDKATIHTPLPCVLDVLEHKPADANVKLVVFGTGKYLTADVEENTLREHYINFGVAGNLVKGRELEELEGYTMSAARQVLYQALGPDNIIEITPRLSPHNYTESKEFPSRNMVDSSPENLQKILNVSLRLIQEEDEQIRNLAQMLIDNLYAVGQMDQEKHRRVSQKLQTNKELPVSLPVAFVTESIEPPAPSSPGKLPPPPPVVIKTPGKFSAFFNRVSSFFSKPKEPPALPPPSGSDDTPRPPVLHP